MRKLNEFLERWILLFFLVFMVSVGASILSIAIKLNSEPSPCPEQYKELLTEYRTLLRVNDGLTAKIEANQRDYDCLWRTHVGLKKGYGKLQAIILGNGLQMPPDAQYLIDTIGGGSRSDIDAKTGDRKGEQLCR